MRKSCLILCPALLMLAACWAKKPSKPLMGGEIAPTAEVDKARKKAAEDYCDVRYTGPLQLQPLQRTGYRAWYSRDLRIPYAVAWHLTANHTSGKNKRQGQAFHEDRDVASPRVTTYDYMQSGYDRGHMCPSGDNKWDAKAQEESFLLTNVCPQNHNLNAGDWNDLEMLCRTWAHRYGSIYIVCGPILLGDQHRRIGKSRVTVPEAFYKVVLRMGDRPAAIGFVYENKGQHQPMEETFCAVDDIEELTGLDFFHLLPDDIEDKIEYEADLGDW